LKSKDDAVPTLIKGSSVDHQSSHNQTHAQEGGKFIVDSAEFVDYGAPLPDTYGDNRLVLMARDPSIFFSYWDITAGKIQSIQDQYGDDVLEKSRIVLRVFEVNGDGSYGNYFDVDVQLSWLKTYVTVQSSCRQYAGELGLILPDGRFIALLKSNRIKLPRGRVSERTDSQFMSVNVKSFEWQRILEASGIDKVGRGSSEASRIMAQRWEYLRAVFSGTSMWLSSSGRPWSGLLPSSKEKI
jgi:hypothetical protein